MSVKIMDIQINYFTFAEFQSKMYFGMKEDFFVFAFKWALDLDLNKIYSHLNKYILFYIDYRFVFLNKNKHKVIR